MSDPVKNVEIEDVLSSIRRLVTEEGRAVQAKPAPKLAQPVGRLVLTPSLRVPESSDAVGDAALADTVQPDAVEVPTAKDEAEPPVPEGGEVLTLSRDLRSVSYADEIEFRNDAKKLRGEDRAAEMGADNTEKPGPKDVTYDLPTDPMGGFAEDRTPWKRPEATLREAAAKATDVPAADDAENSANSDTPRVKAAPEAVVSEPAQQAAAMRSATLSAKIKALEAAIAERAEKWEPDGSAEEVFESSGHAPLKWRDHAEKQTADAEPENVDATNKMIDAAPGDETPEAEETNGETTEAVEIDAKNDPDAEAEDEADDAVMDEEALRELVAEIVRQELRGALGERITRNVRKLVRREIQRALAAQALE